MAVLYGPQKVSKKMDHVNIYRKAILNNFNAIESITGQTIQSTHPGLEDNFWKASDDKNKSKLMFLKNQTDKIIDTLKGIK